MTLPCRVLSITNALGYGGDENRLLSFATHVNPKRLNLRVGVIKRLSPELDLRYGTLRPEFKALGIPILEVGEPRPDRRGNNNMLRRVDRTALSHARAVRKLVKYVYANQIDVIDGHVGTGNHIAAIVGLITRRPVIATTYHAEFFEPRWLSYPVEQVMLRSSAAIVTDSYQRANAIRRFMSGSRPRIEVIVNGVAPVIPKRRCEDIRAELNIPSDATVVIGQVAGLVASKGWLVFLEAAKLVLEHEPKAFFLCIGHQRGDLTFKARMEARAVELGISERVTITGYDGPIGDVWQLIDIHSHASLFDSLPNAIIEGMSVAKPSVVTDVGDVSKMVEDGRSGFVVPPNDSDAFGRKLLHLITDLELRGQFAAEAHARYLERHQPITMSSRLEDLCIELAQR